MRRSPAIASSKGSMLSYLSVLRGSLYLVLGCLFLTPSIKISAGLPMLRLEEVVVAGVFGYAMAASLSGATVRIAWGLRQTMLLGFVIFILISINTGAALGFPGSLGDLNQLIRVAKFIGIYTLCISVISFANNPNVETLKILRFVMFLSVVVFLISVQQYFNLFGLNASYVETIAPIHGERLLEGSWPRPVGMIGNPNELGFMFALAGLVAVFLLTTRFRLAELLVAAANVLGILLTGSRSSLVVFAAGALLLVALRLLDGRGIRISSLIKVMTTAVVMGVIVATTFFPSQTTERISARFDDLAAPTEATSFQARLVRWQDALALFEQSPIVGVGPLRRAEMDLAVVDNEWLLLLRSYGIAGTIWLALAMLLPHWRSHRTATTALTTASLFAAAIYMIPAAVFHSLALMPLLLVILGLSDTTARRAAM